MSLFGNSRKNDENFKIQLERETLERLNSDKYDSISPFEFSDTVVGAGNIKAPNVITAEELMGKPQKEESFIKESVQAEDIPMSSLTNTSSVDFLYKKMVESRQKNLEHITEIPSKDAVEQEKEVIVQSVPVEPKKPFDLAAAMMDLRKNVKGSSQRTLEVEKINLTNDGPIVKQVASPTKPETITKDIEISKPTEAKDSMAEPAKPESNISMSQSSTPQSAEARRTSLLARCNAYLEDEEFGNFKKDTEKYRLESVESILADFENKATQKVLKNLSKTNGGAKIVVAPDTNSKNKPQDDKNKALENNDTTKAPEQKKSLSDTRIIEPVKQEEKIETKHHFVADMKHKSNASKETVEAATTKIVLDPEKIGLAKPPITNTATQVFTTISSFESNEINNKQKEASYKTSPINEDIDSFPEDYKDVSDKGRIASSLKDSKRKLTARILPTFILLIMSAIISTPIITYFGDISPYIVPVLNFIISILAICFNLNIIKSLPSLFRGEADTDLPAALAAVAVTLHSAVGIILPEKAISLSGVMIISLLFTNLAKRSIYKFISRNFDFIVDNETKKAAAIVTNPAANKIMAGDAIDGGSLICCGVKTTNIHNFLKYSYCGDPTAKRVKNMAKFGLIAGLILGALATIISLGNFSLGFSVFVAAVCIAAMPITVYIAHLPFKSAEKRLSYYSAMLTGYKAATELDHCNAVAIDCKDLFPDGTIRLVDMKLLSPNPIDQSMLDAEALANAVGSPIAGIFSQVSNTIKGSKPLKVDTPCYEDKMGISGWVDDRRVFVGNRVLLEAHGFTHLPPIELDKKIMRKGFFPIYLVSDNVPCAMFVVKYVPDEEIAYEMRRLCNTGTTVLVNNCDPNISANMLCDYFGLMNGSVSVMSKQGSNQFEIVSEFKENRKAGAAFKDNICGLFSILTAAINAKRSVGVMSILYAITIILGLTVLTVIALTSASTIINFVTLAAFYLVSSVIICLPILLNRP